MKYIKNYLFALAVAALAVAACDKTKVPEYESAPAINSEQVFFPASVGDQIKIADGETSFTIPLQRGTANLEAIDVAISATGEGLEYFTVPGTVSFAAQAKTANLTISISDPEGLGKNNFYPLTLTIADDALTTPYARKSVTILAGIELPWIKFDTGTYYSFWNDVELERTVEYQQISANMRYCRIQNFWDDEDDPMDIFWYWNTDTDICFVTPTVLEPYDGANNCVMSDMASFYTKYQGWEGDVGVIGSEDWFNWAGPWMVNRADYPFYDGNGTFYLADWFYIASAEDGIPTGRGWMFGGAPGDGDWFKGNSFGDYTLEIAYGGMYVNPDGEAVPILNFTSTKASAKYYSEVKYVITDQQTDAAETLKAIVNGEIETVESVTLVDLTASVQPEIEPGLYRLVAVPYVKGDKNDKGESTEYKTLFAQTIDFYFPGLNVAPKEVEAQLVVTDLADIFGEEFCEENGYYDYNSFGYAIIGTDIKSGARYVNKTSTIATWTGTPEELVAAYGTALTDAQISDINSEAGYANGFINRDPDTEYTMYVVLENVYGATKLLTGTYKTGAVPYSGELVIGSYVISGEEDQCVINLIPTTDETTFYVSDLGIKDGSSWLATYDSEAHTLTLDGTLKGYESYGQLFGAGLFYYDEAETMYYGTFVYDSDDSEGDDSLIFTVDADTKELTSILQDVEIAVFADEDDSYLGSYAYFEAGSKVTYTPANSASTNNVSKKLSKSSVKKQAKSTTPKIPYRIDNMEDALDLPAANFYQFEKSAIKQEGWGTVSAPIRKSVAKDQPFELITYFDSKF